MKRIQHAILRLSQFGQSVRLKRGLRRRRAHVVETLETRGLLAATVSNASFLASGTLTANSTSLTVSFSEPVLGGTTEGNYELRRAGADGLLGSTDDPIVTISSVSMSGNAATLNFAALPEDVYRLTVKDTIIDATGNALDGDGNGTAGGNWRKDFVANIGETTSDPLFGTGGRVQTNLSGETVVPSEDTAQSMAVQADGKILVASQTRSLESNGTDVAVTRYLANGSLDTSFGVAGTALIDFGGDQDQATGIAIQNDGAIVVSGWFTLNATNEYKFAVARLTSSGQLDTTFDGDGKLTFDFGVSTSSYPSAGVAISGTKIIVGGYSGDEFAVAQLNIDGTFDSSFDGDGKLTFGFGSPQAIAEDMVVAPDGKIVLVGYSYNGVSYDMAVARLNPNGTLDASFDGDGRAIVDFGGGFELATAVAVQPGLEIVIAGYGGSSSDYRVARLTNSGQLDTSFDGDGKLTVNFNSGIPQDVALQGSRIVIAGYGTFGNGGDFTVMRLNSDGSFDTTFDGDGKFNAANVSSDYAAAMALTDNGNRILLAGYAANNVSGIDIQDVVLVQVTDQRIGRMQSPHELTFDVDLSGHGTGQLVQGDYGVFDGLNMLEVGGFATLNNASSSQDGGRSVVLSGLPVVSLTIGREVTVPNTGSQDFTRTIDVFTNNTGGSISTTVRLMGNLGSDAATTVFATSDGDTLVEPTDWWFGTDDGDGTGTPAVIHLIHGPNGLIPSSVAVIEDNVDWTYNLTVAPGETQRLATFTILSNTRAEAISAVNALISNGGFDGEAASFLTQAELDSLANFQFNQAPTDIALSNSSLPENAGADYIIGSLSGNDPNGDALSFSVPANLGSNNLFNISGTSLRTNNSFNFEAGHSYLITVRATDSGGLTFDKQFTITITDVNETPTAVTLTPSSLTLPENYSTSAAVAVSTIAVTDDALGTNSLTLSGPDAGSFEIVGNQLRLKAGVILDFEAKSSFSVTVNVDDTAVGGAAPDAFATFTLALTNVTELGGIDAQLGQSQRSYVRYLDVLFDRPDDILSMINTGRVNLTKKDLNGLSPVSVPLTPSMFTQLGNKARIDFGANGLGGNRNTTAGDGYYELGVDMDGIGSFESKKYFYRLLGDVNGDRKVDSTDSNLVTSAFGTTNPERDVNGDGTVNSNDRTLVLRSVGRKLEDDLFADD